MKKRILLIILLVFFAVSAITLFLSCEETQDNGTVTLTLTGASAADGQGLYAFLYAGNETDINNAAKLVAMNQTVINNGTAAFVLEVSDGAWQSSGTDWIGTAGLSYDVYIYTDSNADGDNDPATASGSPLPKMTDPYPQVVTIAGDQAVNIAYSDMVDYDFNNTITVTLTGASAADSQECYAFLYAENETDINNPAKLLATNSATISGGSASFILEVSDGAWEANGTNWLGIDGISYDLYFYTDSNVDNDYEPQTHSGSPVPQMTSPYPQVVTIDGPQTIDISFSEMVDYDFGGTVTVILTDAADVNDHYLFSFLYAEDESDAGDAAKLIATNSVIISGGTATIVLEKSDGAWGGDGTVWVGTEGTSYDLYIYTDDNEDEDVNPTTPTNTPLPQKTNPFPDVITVDENQSITISYFDMVDYNPQLQ